MRQAFYLMLIALAAAAGLVLLTHGEPGYVLVALGDYTFESTAWGLAALLLLMCGGVYGLLHLGQGWRWFRNLQLWRPRNSSVRGLLAFLEGDWKRARRLLLAGARGSQSPLVNYLTAARASFALGEHDQADDLLREAIASTPGADLAVGLTQAEMQLSAGQLESALATLLRLQAIAPRHPVVLKELARSYQALKDWTPLAALLPQLAKAKVFDAAELGALRTTTYAGLLEQSKDAATLQAAWAELPKLARQEPALIALYARALVARQAPVVAEKQLREALNRQWDEQLALGYGLAVTDDLPRQRKQLENWLKDQPNSPGLLISAGRLARAAGDMPAARRHLEAAAARAPSPETLAELGRLLLATGDARRAAEAFERGLARAQGAS